MSVVSSAHKVQNMDNKLIKELQDILKYCKTHGHQPEPNSESGKRLSSVPHLIYIRTRKNISVPAEIVSLYEEIRSYTTYEKHKRKEIKLATATAITKKKNTFEQRRQKIQELTPYNLEIFRLICGEETFTKFVNTDIDPFITKIFLEYTYKKYFQKIDARTRHIIILNTGIYADSKHIIDTELQNYWVEDSYLEEFGNYYSVLHPIFEKVDKKQDLTVKELKLLYYEEHKYLLLLDYNDFVKFIKNPSSYPDKRTYYIYKKNKDKFEQEYQIRKQTIENYAKKQPLTKAEIGSIFHLHPDTIRDFIRKAHNKFYENTTWESLLNAYLGADAKKFMDCLPDNEATLYKYQQEMKLQNIPTDELNTAGRTLMSFFGKGKSKA